MKHTRKPKGAGKKPGHIVSDHSVSVRLQKIANGHLRHVTHSGRDADGNYQYEEQTYYHRKDPSQHAGRLAAAFKRMTGKDMG